MESPVFKLEQVVHNREGLEDFEGPLDLILFLLSKNKIEIQDIPIALILDQYLAYLELRQQMDLEVASEFITMAAQLMFIKTRMLLSIEDEEAQSEMDLLIRSLEERRSSENYARIKTAAARLGPMGEFGRNIMFRGPEPVERILKGALENQVSALATCQAESGMWHTLLDDPDSYEEASATCGFAYGILRGVHAGILDAKWESVARKALRPILSLISDEGVVEQVSYGTPMGRISKDFYKTIPIQPMPYGQALAILFLIEIGM